jgi:hypothetical protein
LWQRRTPFLIPFQIRGPHLARNRGTKGNAGRIDTISFHYHNVKKAYFIDFRPSFFIIWKNSLIPRVLLSLLNRNGYDLLQDISNAL